MELLSVFIAAGSLMAGISFTYKVAFNHSDLFRAANLEESDLVYFLIGGAAIVWMAAWEIYRKCKELFL